MTFLFDSSSIFEIIKKTRSSSPCQRKLHNKLSSLWIRQPTMEV